MTRLFAWVSFDRPVHDPPGTAPLLSQSSMAFDCSRSKAAPHGASSSGPPAPRRLEQPLPRTSPMSDVPRRRRGHRPPDPCAGEQLAPGTHLAVRVAGLTRVTKTAPYPFLAGEVRDDRNAFRRVAPDRVAPAVEPRLSRVTESIARLRAPFSPRDATVACVSTPCGAPLASTSQARSALRLVELRGARCVGPTSAISRLDTSTRASSVPG